MSSCSDDALPFKTACWFSALAHHDLPARIGGQLPGSERHNRCMHCAGEFDFAHKRAALLMLGRYEALGFER